MEREEEEVEGIIIRLTLADGYVMVYSEHQLLQSRGTVGR